MHGILSPASFLPGASESSHAALTEHVITTALRDWDEIAETGMQLHAAVNTSIGALANLQLPALIREHRSKSADWPGLILEVTESEVVKDVALMHEIATQLRIYGITFAIDDFGEGFSSFARLRDLPFAELKLDRSFVKDSGTRREERRHLPDDHQSGAQFRRARGRRRPGKCRRSAGRASDGLRHRTGLLPGAADAEGELSRAAAAARAAAASQLKCLSISPCGNSPMAYGKRLTLPCLAAILNEPGREGRAEYRSLVGATDERSARGALGRRSRRAVRVTTLRA